MDVALARSIAGSLSEPSKLPGHSYGLPARECITGRKLVGVAGSTCANCYAFKGMYRTFAYVINPAQYKRLRSITHPDWVAAMVTLIRASGDTVFRWHDSGDIQSLAHLRRIALVAELLPGVRFWLPTREYAIVRQFCAIDGAFPSNLVVRLSAHMVDGPIPDICGLPTSGVHTVDPIGFACPARAQGNVCGDCRACWDSNVRHVSYHLH